MDVASAVERDRVALVPHGDWDPRILICRCAPTVDAFIVVTARYVVLIDTLLNPATAGAMLTLAREHLGSGRTLLVVNTHADWDHCWGNQLFAGPDATTPAPIIATVACGARFRAGGVATTLASQRAAQPERFAAVCLVAPTILFDERLTIDGGDLTLELFRAPGHTDDHLAIFIPEIGTLLAGDAAESPFPFAASAEGLPQLRATLARLALLRPPMTLYCHAPETSGPALLDRNTAYFDRLEAVCRAALARGVPPTLITETDAEMLGSFPFGEAISGIVVLESQMATYLDGHRAHLRMMLDWLARTW